MAPKNENIKNFVTFLLFLSAFVAIEGHSCSHSIPKRHEVWKQALKISIFIATAKKPGVNMPVMQVIFSIHISCIFFMTKELTAGANTKGIKWLGQKLDKAVKIKALSQQLGLTYHSWQWHHGFHFGFHFFSIFLNKKIKPSLCLSVLTVWHV